MIAKMARYRIKPENQEEALKVIEAFVAAVKEKETDTLRYVAYHLDDNVSFVHIMYFKNEKAEELHRNTDHVKAFVKGLYPLCEQEPEFADIQPVPSYIL